MTASESLQPQQFPQYDLRPNIKAKEGSQGTLFHISPDARTDESRYPRGYTPERMREVRENLHVAPLSQNEVPGLSSGSRLSVSARHERGVNEAVARSSVPASNLIGAHVTVDTRKLQRLHAGGLREDGPVPGTSNITLLPMHDGVGDSRRARGVRAKSLLRATAPERGGWRQDILNADRRNSLVAAENTAERQHTVLHEIGHHVSRAQEGNPRSGPLVAHRSGEWSWDAHEEARADAYAAHNFRPDRRLPKVDPPESGYVEHRNRAYIAERARRGAPVPEQFGHQRTLPPPREEQVPLLHKVTPYGSRPENTRWEYTEENRPDVLGAQFS